MKNPIIGYFFDAFVIGCMTALVLTKACEMKDFFIVVSPIVGVRIWMMRNGGPPSSGGGLACSAAALVFIFPVLCMFFPRLMDGVSA